MYRTLQRQSGMPNFFLLPMGLGSSLWMVILLYDNTSKKENDDNNNNSFNSSSNNNNNNRTDSSSNHKDGSSQQSQKMIQLEGSYNLGLLPITSFDLHPDKPGLM
eukprot:Awhi_evm1s3392